MTPLRTTAGIKCPAREQAQATSSNARQRVHPQSATRALPFNSAVRRPTVQTPLPLLLPPAVASARAKRKLQVERQHCRKRRRTVVTLDLGDIGELTVELTIVDGKILMRVDSRSLAEILLNAIRQRGRVPADCRPARNL